jgi:hypothetical protein
MKHLPLSLSDSFFQNAQMAKMFLCNRAKTNEPKPPRTKQHKEQNKNKATKKKENHREQSNQKQRGNAHVCGRHDVCSGLKQQSHVV